MDKMTLRQYCDICKEIDELEERRLYYVAKIESIPVLDGQPKKRGLPGDPAGELAAKLADTCRDIEEKQCLLINRRQEIEEVISPLSSRERRIMRMHYFDGLSWSRVTYNIFGDKPDFKDRFDSYLRRIHRYHGAILKKIC